jgi:N-acetylmuramate 1-kinase
MSVSVEPIEKGGSGRKFWRVNVAGRSLILVRYGEERPENRYYVEIAQFLASVGVSVPGVHFHDASEGIILMEDAGENDLWSHRHCDWVRRRALYQRTLDQALILHTRAHLAPGRPHLQQEFNSALYSWEQDYFIEHCLGRHLGIRDPGLKIERSRLAEIAAELASQPRCLVHRDFQSQNIIIRDGMACLIDFQGLRPGLPQYDLASLLLDPYVNLTPAEHDELLLHYLSGLCGPGIHDHTAFRRIYDLCAMQRLMQALGAYGKLGHADGRASFLAHIPTAIARLRPILARIGGLERLLALLELG